MDNKKKYLIILGVALIMILGLFLELRDAVKDPSSSSVSVTQTEINETTESSLLVVTTESEQIISGGGAVKEPDDISQITTEAAKPQYHFRNSDRLNEHYEKHGKEMGFSDAASYEAAAAAVVCNPAALHKTEKEDGDDVYYLEATNEFVIVSTDGYLRTYFNPNDGIKYYNRQ